MCDLLRTRDKFMNKKKQEAIVVIRYTHERQLMIDSKGDLVDVIWYKLRGLIYGQRKRGYVGVVRYRDWKWNEDCNVHEEAKFDLWRWSMAGKRVDTMDGWMDCGLLTIGAWDDDHE